MTNAEQEAAPVQGYKFGTFGGVFTPSILTIFGLIMFMRANYVVGQMGIGLSLAILGIAAGITLSTGLSIAVISTNTPVKGGGAYYLISRALGPAFGSSIGVTLYLAQTLSVPFYLLGFAEAVATRQWFLPAFCRPLPKTARGFVKKSISVWKRCRRPFSSLPTAKPICWRNQQGGDDHRWKIPNCWC